MWQKALNLISISKNITKTTHWGLPQIHFKSDNNAIAIFFKVMFITNIIDNKNLVRFLFFFMYTSSWVWCELRNISISDWRPATSDFSASRSLRNRLHKKIYILFIGNLNMNIFIKRSRERCQTMDFFLHYEIKTIGMLVEIKMSDNGLALGQKHQTMDLS